MRSHADVDPNAPPALKASPSVSGSDAGQPHMLSVICLF